LLQEKQLELKKLQEAFEEALQEETLLSGKAEPVLKEDLQSLTVEIIQGIAASFTLQQLDSFKESMLQKIEEQETHVVETVSNKIEERRKSTPTISTDNVRGKTPDSSRKIKRRNP
jgi:hypothetical protein